MAKRKHYRELLQLARDMLAPHGMTATLETRGNANPHLRLRVVHGAQHRSYSVPSSPRDRDEQKDYLRKWLRRTIEELSDAG